MPAIYGLVDPRDGRVRYVGKTKCDLDRRLRTHLNAARHESTRPVIRWMRKLLDVDLIPAIMLIEQDPDDLNAAEIKWIAHYRDLHGPGMLNVANGGEGGNPTLSGCVAMKDRHSEWGKMGAPWAKRNGTRGGEASTWAAIARMKAKHGT